MSLFIIDIYIPSKYRKIGIDFYKSLNTVYRRRVNKQDAN